MAAGIGKYLKACKVCLLGANGRIGRHLAINLKLNQDITELSLYDISDIRYLREDLSHIDTSTRVTAFFGDEKSLIDCLKCSNLVVIVAGQARSVKHLSREALFDVNAGMLLEFMKAITMACHNDMPFIYVTTNPVNSTIPLCAEYLKDVGSFNPRKLIGSTSVDTLRARTFLGQLVDYRNPSKIVVPVIGGHSSSSITPLVSQRKPKFKLSEMELQQLAERIINGATEVTKALKDTGSAYLSTAYCVGKFCASICRAITKDKSVVEVGYVPADVNECEYFSCNFTVNAEGISEFHRLPPMSPYEIELYYKAVKDIQSNIDKAKTFYENLKLKKCRK